MQDFEKLGVFYLGKTYDPAKKKVKEDDLILYDSKHLTTHAVILGMTGSGKTGLGITILEEAAMDGIPALIIDPKGDMTNLLLTFPELRGKDFLPWINSEEAERKGITREQEADNIAKTWKEGLAQWGENGSRIEKLKDSVDWAIYTPASNAGLQISILSTFAAPPKELLQDAGAFRDLVLSTTSSLLGLIGIDADPVQSREHILISTLFDQAWQKGQNMDIPTLIQGVQRPPFNKIGVLDLESFFPNKDRQALAMRLNNLLASPGFQAWMQGEPLDIQRLLYTKEGRPRHAILSIAHLQDSERMFFVTMLLNHLVAWMRRQPGTSSLRAIMYMDEIFGFFPPSAMPPSKRPMLTLLKQARAFGVGIVLSTQNPVDLDYKGLANCGTWYVGKLQTDKDRSRVIEGLSVSSNGNESRESMEAKLSAVGTRTFLLRSIYAESPTLFQTRWTLSYLKGPLTLPQIEILMAKKDREEAAEEESVKADTTLKATPKPSIPSGVKEFYLPPKNVQGNQPYYPRILGIGKLHYVDSKTKTDLWKEYVLAAPLSDDGSTVLWNESDQIETASESLRTEQPQNAAFEELPSGLMNQKNYSDYNKSFGTYLYQNQVYDVFVAPSLKIVSKGNETEGDLRSRIGIALREKRDQDIQKLRDRYQPKITSLMEKIKRAQDKLEVKQTQASQSKLETYVSAGATLLGAILGRGRITSTTVTQAGSTIRKAGRISKQTQDVEQSESSLTSLQQQLNDIDDELEREIEHVQSASPDDVKIDTVALRPRKGDVTVDNIAVLWSPKGVES